MIEVQVVRQECRDDIVTQECSRGATQIHRDDVGLSHNIWTPKIFVPPRNDYFRHCLKYLDPL